MKKIFLFLTFTSIFGQGHAQPGPTNAKRPYSIHKSFGLDDPLSKDYLGNRVQSVDLSFSQGRGHVIAQDPAQTYIPPFIPTPPTPTFIPQPIQAPAPAPAVQPTQPLSAPPPNTAIPPTFSHANPETPAPTTTPHEEPVVQATPEPVSPVQTTPNIFATSANNVDRSQMCEKFGQILGGEFKSEHGVCIVQRPRHLEAFKLGGQVTNSFLVSGASFSFEGFDQNGVALNLGEVILLPDEVEPFRRALNKQSGMVMTGIQSQWQETTNPLLYRVQWYYVGHPLDFADRVARALTSLKHF